MTQMYTHITTQTGSTGEDVENWNRLTHCGWECKNCPATLENGLAVLQMFQKTHY